jgi:hypothetical protein
MRRLGATPIRHTSGASLAASAEQAAELRLAAVAIESRQSADHKLDHL